MSFRRGAAGATAAPVVLSLALQWFVREDLLSNVLTHTEATTEKIEMLRKIQAFRVDPST